MANQSSELKRDVKCSKCGLLLTVCQCDSYVELGSETFRAFLSVETRGSADDVVTVIEKLPPSEAYLKTLLKKITTDCQARGSYRLDKKYSMIELVGDKRVKLRQFFEKQKIVYVG
ncbi:MAG: hypothetical protein EXS63_09045 [Candidatus Omnitrophica bacterium]|nr:hypothetical protein [Candidatus Omnitrophota bacterium]